MPKCEDCQYFKLLGDGEEGRCSERRNLVVGCDRDECGFFWEKEDVKSDDD